MHRENVRKDSERGSLDKCRPSRCMRVDLLVADELHSWKTEEEELYLQP